MLPREVPSLYGSFPIELHAELEGFVPSADLDKARNRAAQERAAAAPRTSALSLEQWRWGLSVSSHVSFKIALQQLDSVVAFLAVGIS